MADRKQAIATIKIPENQRQLCGFLGITGFCQTWILNFGLLVKPLYNSLKGLRTLKWRRDCHAAFDTLNEELVFALTTELPNLQEPLKLYIYERQGIGPGVLTQTLGKCPSTHSLSLKETRSLDKQVATMPLGNSSYLWHLSRSREVHPGATSYCICTTLGPNSITTERREWADSRVHGKISGHFIRRYLTNHHCLKPSYLTPGLYSCSDLQHHCLEIIDQVYSSRPDLLDQPRTEPDWKLYAYTDGSSFMNNGQEWARYSVVMIDKVIEAEALSVQTSAQKARLLALTRALELSQGKNVNIYTD